MEGLRDDVEGFDLGVGDIEALEGEGTEGEEAAEGRVVDVGRSELEGVQVRKGDVAPSQRGGGRIVDELCDRFRVL